VLGVIYDPVRDDLWCVDRSGPVTLNGDAVSASTCDALEFAMVATGFGYDAAIRERQAAVVARVIPRVRDIRRVGSAALDLAWAAGGRYDAYYEWGVQPWDIAAGELMCTRAGLAAQHLPGGDGLPPGLLVAPPALIDAVRGLLDQP
jgi:myo-inositol-1(or 4)-monophosphatase